MSALDAFRLDGKVAIVTGAGRGIGASIARTYADAGANVLLAARTQEQLDEVAADVRGFGREALVVPCDVTNQAEVDAAFKAVGEKYGKLDFLIHSIAFAPREALDGEFLTTTREAFLTAMEISALKPASR